MSPRVISAAVLSLLFVLVVGTICMIVGFPGPDKQIISENRVTWEEISRGYSNRVYRTEVPGGWLVRTYKNGAVTFIPDPQHEWLK